MTSLHGHDVARGIDDVMTPDSSTLDKADNQHKGKSALVLKRIPGISKANTMVPSIINVVQKLSGVKIPFVTY